MEGKLCLIVDFFTFSFSIFSGLRYDTGIEVFLSFFFLFVFFILGGVCTFCNKGTEVMGV
ncbi:hypothetical protein FPQ18DRAFT_171984 [Pyronema domesticum]|nr:hypothetical protein FPQ18DRAFT_171984 [Pyronema domesticum]